jgi:radical SAM superfamily enzyme YgiQ (UPF0313 family)
LKVTLIYPPQQSRPDIPHKPEASLAYPYLAGGLLDLGVDVSIYDACVGNSKDPEDVFYNSVDLPSGLRRYGVSDNRILEEVSDSDLIGITSIFTAQETMALYVGRLIKKHFPDKVLVCGGTNARSRPGVFIKSGFDMVCMSEAEYSLQAIAYAVWNYRPTRRFYRQPVITNLDNLPIPAWELHQNDRYWRLGKPHGSAQGGGFKYAPIMTSRGCVFRCSYCHISGEQGICKFRVKSLDRVSLELKKLRTLGVENLFIEDDTLFGNKPRGLDVLRLVQQFSFKVWDINGVNIAHLFKGSEPDQEVLDALQACGFAALTIPVESGSQRILDKYASRKWQVARYDISKLIKGLNSRGIKAGVNYMLGYPDETLEEMQSTIALAQKLRDAGANSSNFMIVIPLPGTAIYEMAIREGYLDLDFNPDTFNWRQASMKNTTVPASQIEEMQAEAYAKLN